MWIRFGRSGGPVPVSGRAPTGHDEAALTVLSPGKDNYYLKLVMIQKILIGL